MRTPRRKPTAIVQVGLRLREALRRELEEAARKHQVSFNQELTARLEESLEMEAKLSLQSMVADMERRFTPNVERYNAMAARLEEVTKLKERVENLERKINLLEEGRGKT
jgi:hypothetical protein